MVIINTKQRLYLNKSMQQIFTLSLPLSLGADIARLQAPTLSINTGQCELAVTIPADVMQIVKNSSKSAQRFRVVQDSIVNNNHQVLLAKPKILINQQNSQEEGFPISLNEHNQSQSYLIFPFRLKISVKAQSLHTKISKLALSFKITLIPRPKFVKTQRLQSLSSHFQPQWGLLTMDQSQRIVLQGHQTPFPAIGIWLSGPPLSPLLTAQQLARYIAMPLPKKCKFSLQNRKFMYLALCPPNCKTPELHIVEWITPEEILSHMEYVIDKSGNHEVVVRSNEQSHLEFTLRSDQKIPQRLMNIDCSPIIFHEDNSNSLEQVLLQRSPQPKQKQEEDSPDSPRFKDPVQPQSRLEIQCASLRRLVRMQQHQINQLRQQLLRVTSALMPKSHTPPKRIQQNKGKMLTERDLSLTSTPRSDQPSTLASSDPNEEWNPWEHFIIEDK